MKYLALLRDSFREALDSKVIYFTFGLTVLLLLFMSSLGFRPVTVKEKMDKDLTMGQMFPVKAVGPGDQFVMPRFRVTDAVPLNEDTPPWQGGQRITLKLEVPMVHEEGEGQKPRLPPIKVTKADLEKKFPWLIVDEVKEPVVDEDRNVKIEFTTSGTKYDNGRDWPHEPSLFFGTVPLIMLQPRLSESVQFISLGLVSNLGGWVVVLLGVIITAFFIPNMLQKGTVDLLLVKPIGRVTLLIFKYLGGLTFVFINSLVAIGGTWLVLGLKTGVWTYSFPLTILVLTFFFAILYSVSALFGVLTRSSVLSIFMTCLVWFLLYVLGQFHSVLNADQAVLGPMPQASQAQTDKQGKKVADSDPILRQVTDILNVVHWILPRTSDLGFLTSKMVSEELAPKEETLTDFERWIRQQQQGVTEHYEWGESVGMSLAFIGVLLGLGCWRFAVRDY